MAATKYLRKPNRPPGVAVGTATTALPATLPNASRQMVEIPSMPHASSLPADLRPIHVDPRVLSASGVHSGAQHNPSVCVHNGELRAVVRVLMGSKSYNFIGRVNGDWELENEREVRNLAPHVHSLHGYEDLRLFVLGDQLMASATTFDTLASIAVLTLDAAGDIAEVSVQRSSHRNEKNWMPLVIENDVWFIHSIEPSVSVLRYSRASRTVSPNADSIPSLARTLRGGSQLVPYKDGYLAVIHHVHQPPGSRVVYLHRFVRFDRFAQVVRMSDPFYFKSLGIEFCAGLAFWRGKWVLSFGYQDRESCLSIVEESVVDRMVS